MSMTHRLSPHLKKHGFWLMRKASKKRVNRKISNIYKKISYTGKCLNKLSPGSTRPDIVMSSDSPVSYLSPRSCSPLTRISEVPQTDPSRKKQANQEQHPTNTRNPGMQTNPARRSHVASRGIKRWKLPLCAFPKGIPEEIWLIPKRPIPYIKVDLLKSQESRSKKNQNTAGKNLSRFFAPEYLNPGNLAETGINTPKKTEHRESKNKFPPNYTQEE